MTIVNLGYFVGGALILASLAISAFFLRFHRDTRQPLFLAFAAAFFLFALNWILLTVIHSSDESRPYLYLLRLTAYALILWGIYRQNRPRPNR